MSIKITQEEREQRLSEAYRNHSPESSKNHYIVINDLIEKYGEDVLSANEKEMSILHEIVNYICTDEDVEKMSQGNDIYAAVFRMSKYQVAKQRLYILRVVAGTLKKESEQSKKSIREVLEEKLNGKGK